MNLLFPTTLVGSYPQPDWLIDKARLIERVPPRVRATELWRVPAQYLQEAQEDATLVAIRARWGEAVLPASPFASWPCSAASPKPSPLRPLPLMAWLPMGLSVPVLRSAPRPAASRAAA